MVSRSLDCHDDVFLKCLTRERKTYITMCAQTPELRALDSLGLLTCLIELFHIYGNAVLDRLPCSLLHQRHQSDRDVGQHEEGEGEQILYFLRRCGADIVPLGEGGERTEHEHEQRIVEQAEEDRTSRRC